MDKTYLSKLADMAVEMHDLSAGVYEWCQYLLAGHFEELSEEEQNKAVMRIFYLTVMFRRTLRDTELMINNILEEGNNG